MESDRIKIIVENKIPYFRGLLDNVADVEYLAPEDITPETVRDADAIVTRTRTKCDERLLKNSKCSLIASATIGLDHVDLDWCKKNGITVKNAPGCNAPAVAQYVFASLLALNVEFKDKCLGVVGAGNVGEIVCDWARQLGMRVIVNDPPREKVEGHEGFVNLDIIAREADIISFHTPYIIDTEYPTHHLFDAEFAAKLKRKPIIINSARGAITDTEAILDGLESGLISNVIIDCWEGEPEISRQLLDVSAISTPHIAGYSRQGKQRASYMVAREIASKFKLEISGIPQLPYLPDKVTAGDISSSYNPLDDSAALKHNPEKFEVLRNTYNLRTEVLFQE